jgi:tetratricopeptide (TPR) repeat protein
LSTLLVAGSAARARGEFGEAEPLLRDALASAERAVPRDDHTLAVALNALGLLCKDLGRWDEARGHYVRALGLLDAADADPDDIASLWHNLGGIAIRRAAGSDARSVAADEVALAALLDGLGRYAEAERLYRGAIAVFEAEPAGELELAVAPRRPGCPVRPPGSPCGGCGAARPRGGAQAADAGATACGYRADAAQPRGGAAVERGGRSETLLTVR